MLVKPNFDDTRQKKGQGMLRFISWAVTRRVGTAWRGSYRYPVTLVVADAGPGKSAYGEGARCRHADAAARRQILRAGMCQWDSKRVRQFGRDAGEVVLPQRVSMGRPGVSCAAP